MALLFTAEIPEVDQRRIDNHLCESSLRANWYNKGGFSECQKRHILEQFGLYFDWDILPIPDYRVEDGDIRVDLESGGFIWPTEPGITASWTKVTFYSDDDALDDGFEHIMSEHEPRFVLNVVFNPRATAEQMLEDCAA